MAVCTYISWCFGIFLPVHCNHLHRDVVSYMKILYEEIKKISK